MQAADCDSLLPPTPQKRHKTQTRQHTNPSHRKTHHVLLSHHKRAPNPQTNHTKNPTKTTTMIPPPPNVTLSSPPFPSTKNKKKTIFSLPTELRQRILHEVLTRENLYFARELQIKHQAYIFRMVDVRILDDVNYIEGKWLEERKELSRGNEKWHFDKRGSGSS